MQTDHKLAIKKEDIKMYSFKVKTGHFRGEMETNIHASLNNVKHLLLEVKLIVDS